MSLLPLDQMIARSAALRAVTFIPSYDGPQGTTVAVSGSAEAIHYMLADLHCYFTQHVYDTMIEAAESEQWKIRDAMWDARVYHSDLGRAHQVAQDDGTVVVYWPHIEDDGDKW